MLERRILIEAYARRRSDIDTNFFTIHSISKSTLCRKCTLNDLNLTGYRNIVSSFGMASI